MKHFLAALLLAAAAPALALDPPATVLQGTTAQNGLLPVHVDARGGRILLWRPAPDAAGISLRRVQVGARGSRILLSLRSPDAEGISGRFLYTAALETGLERRGVEEAAGN